MLTLSPWQETNNTFAFKANGKSHGLLTLSINDAFTDEGSAAVTNKLFVVNKWGNWVQFGNPKSLVLSNEPSSHEYNFPIRQGKAFCVVLSAYGASGNCHIPYQVVTR